MHFAVAYKRNPDILKFLLDAGADPNARNKRSWTPLHSAGIYSEDPVVLKLLLDAGADPNVKTYYDWTPLHLAAFGNVNPDVVRMLINAGANLHSRNDDDNTPLDVAKTNNQNQSVAGVLIDAGATRTKKQEKKGTDWGKVAVGVLGGAAIIQAGKDAPKEVVDQALTDWVNVLSERQSTTNAPTSAGASGGAASQDQMHQALQNLENICGGKYQSGFAANDHYRFYCMAAFNDHCALKRAQTEDARTKLRASLAQNCGVLHGIGAAGKCTYCR